MAIEAVAAIAAKEVAVEAAKEAALQAGREIAQKMATEAGAQGAGNELQTAMMERQTMQDGFRVGEMSEGKGEGREFLKQKEADAAEELRGKLDAEEVRPETENTPVNESPEVQNPAETEVTEADAAQEVAESQETVESTELAETQEGGEAAEQLEPTTPKWEDYLAKETSSGKPTYEKLQCGKDSELLNGPLPEKSVLELDNPTGNNHLRVETNGHGRVIELKADRLERLDGGRDIYQQRRCCQIKEGKTGDDGGHLCASDFGGPKEQFNYSPMNSQINRHGECRLMEKHIEKALNSGQTVTEYRIRPAYDGESLRPEKFSVSMKIDGIPKHFHITNPAMVA